MCNFQWRPLKVGALGKGAGSSTSPSPSLSLDRSPSRVLCNTLPKKSASSVHSPSHSLEPEEEVARSPFVPDQPKHTCEHRLALGDAGAGAEYAKLQCQFWINSEDIKPMSTAGSYLLGLWWGNDFCSKRMAWESASGMLSFSVLRSAIKLLLWKDSLSLRGI